jgi:hypothetical protein
MRFFSCAGKADDMKMKRMDQMQERSNVNNIVGKISAMLGETEDKIAVHRKYQKGIWPVKLKGDQINQILFSICLNACSAMPEGGHIYLETVNVAVDSKAAMSLALKPGRYVKVSMTDTGVYQKGIISFVPEQEEWKDCKNSLDHNPAYGIVRRQGSIIVSNHREGNGPTVSIYFPASENEVGGTFL